MAKKSVRQSTIVERVRGQIVGSRFPPGSRLPTRSQLERKFKASLMTVQRALEFLESEGFVCSRGRNGTFVADHPPHLFCYGLVFPRHPSNVNHWVRFWSALTNEAARIQHTSERRFVLFHDMENPTRSEHYERLQAAIWNQRLAGLIFPATPWGFKDTPILDVPGLPKVAVMNEPYRGVHAVALDNQAFFDRAIDYLQSRGRNRIALITVPGSGGGYYSQYFRECITKRGLTCQPWWIQVVAHNAAEYSSNLVRLLLQSNPADRPDGLIVSDDNLVDHVAAGIIQSGLRTPDDLDFVGHCNFPWPAPQVLPVKRLGYDASEVLRACQSVIDLQRQGHDAPIKQVVPPRFEDELLPMETPVFAAEARPAS